MTHQWPGLSADHQAQLEASGITEEVAAARGYKTVNEPDELMALGFTKYQARPGLLVPRWNVWGEQEGYQLRPDRPRNNSAGKPIKYETPKGQRNICDIPPGMLEKVRQPEEAIFITEGAKKADALATLKLPAISLAGVSSWRGKNEAGGHTALTDWSDISIKGNVFVLAFDSDILTKPQVHRALTELRAYLIRRGAYLVNVLVMPDADDGSKLGVDDHIGRGATAQNLSEWTQGELPSLARPFKKYERTDTGNAERFADKYRDLVAWVPNWGWVKWDGQRWQRCEDDAPIKLLAQEMTRDMLREAADEGSQEEVNKAAQWAMQSQSAGKVSATVELAKGRLPKRVEDFDRHHMLLNVANGVLDLETAHIDPQTGRLKVELLPQDPSYYLTRIAPVGYDPDADAPGFEAFEERISGGDTEALGFKQTWFGYCLTGQTGEECFVLAHGAGRNGKSTEIRAVMAVMGEYAATADIRTFSHRENDNGPRNDIARLAGVRFVATQEGNEGTRLDEGLIKNLTGGDVITARFLHKEHFELKPSFKIHLASNHRPNIRGQDEGIWSRVREVPYPVTIPPEERDPHLKDKLERELPGILNWMLRGLAAWREEGLRAPQSVAAATADFKQSSDPIADWYQARAVRVPMVNTPTATLYQDFKLHEEAEGNDHPISVKRFSQLLTNRGHELTRVGAGGTRALKNLRLRQPGDAPSLTDDVSADTTSGVLTRREEIAGDTQTSRLYLSVRDADRATAQETGADTSVSTDASRPSADTSMVREVF